MKVFPERKMYSIQHRALSLFGNKDDHGRDILSAEVELKNWLIPCDKFLHVYPNSSFDYCVERKIILLAQQHKDSVCGIEFSFILLFFSSLCTRCDTEMSQNSINIRESSNTP